jgi:predicted RNase H-like nuclease (RuvC/YqgF family)
MEQRLRVLDENLRSLSDSLAKELAFERQGPEDLEAAGNLIDSLKADLAQEHKNNEALRKEISDLKSKLEAANKVKIPATTNLVSTTELQNEKQRRILAEEELNAYKRQEGLKNASAAEVAHARRVAISLASHCVKLSQENQRLRRGDVPVHTENAKEVIRSAIFHKNEPAAAMVIPKPVFEIKNPKGWGTLDEDDDLFSALN